MPQVDLSLSSVFTQATGVVRAVLAVLLLASVLCWTIILEKAAFLFRLRRQTWAFEVAARQWPVLSRRAESRGLAAAILASGREASVERRGETAADRRDWAERSMRYAMMSELARAEKRLAYLATIASAAPFVGLFGTVWGIMHSFVGIAQAKDASLAVVAPGIAEALSTTAIGLAAAIPAAVGYNMLASGVGQLARRLGVAIGGLAHRLSDATIEGESAPLEGASPK